MKPLNNGGYTQLDASQNVGYLYGDYNLISKFVTGTKSLNLWAGYSLENPYIDDTTVAGIKNVTMNEPFFVGHFPEEPVMPGVLIVEAMAQCCGMLVLRSIPDPEHYSTYFMKIDGVKFKRKVVPGDTLHFEVQLLEPIRRGVAVVEGKAFVGETLACEATMMAQIVKNKE